MKASIFIVFIVCLWPGVTYSQEIEKGKVLAMQEICWGNYQPGRIKADSFRNQIQVKLPAGYVLKKAIVDFCGANFPTVRQYNLYSENLSILKDAISKCLPGTVVYLEKILVVDKKGNETFLSNAGFILY